MYVLRQFDNTSPSLTIPMPNLLALPSKPIAVTISLLSKHDKLKYLVVRLCVQK